MLIAAFASFAILVVVWVFAPSAGPADCEEALD
jgi:hypothetical protein